MLKKHYKIEIRTRSGKIININYFENEENTFKRFTQLLEWHELDNIAIYQKGKDKPLLTYN